MLVVRAFVFARVLGFVHARLYMCVCVHMCVHACVCYACMCRVCVCAFARVLAHVC